MCALRLPFPPKPQRTNLDVETALLYAAYNKKPLSVALTLVSMVILVIVIWDIFPSSLMRIWTVCILFTTATGYLGWHLFRHIGPAPQEAKVWSQIFVVQGLISGASWAIGPTVLAPQLEGAELAILIGILLCVGSVATAAMAEHRTAMQCFLVAELLPPAVGFWHTGAPTSHAVAVTVMCALALMIVVGVNANRSIRALLQTQFQMRAILVNAQDAIVSWDQQNRITAWNLRATVLFAREPSDALGLPVHEVIFPEHERANHRQAQDRYLTMGADGHMNRRLESVALAKNGTEFPIEMAITPLKIGNAVSFTAFITDITQRREHEERLTVFRKVFDSSSQCIGIFDAQGNLTYQNRAHARTLGYTGEESQRLHLSQLLQPLEAEAVRNDIMTSLAQGGDWIRQLQLICKDGQSIVSASNFGSVKDAFDQVQYVFNIFTDFSDELARRNELALAKETAERANQFKTDFLSSMSHELRTPMNAIIGFAQMLQFDAQLAPHLRTNVNEILHASHHLLSLINEVLDLSKIESGHMSLSLEPVNLGAVAEDCRHLVAPLAAARDITLHIDMPPNATVQADHVRLKQALLNLLSNAVKYNRDGGQVMLSARTAFNDFLRITVADTGTGIAPELLSDLFQPFNRLSAEKGDVEGTGIGLTITQRVVEKMGGKIGVTSQVGVGSSFWIDLPTAVADVQNQPQIPTGGLHASPTSVRSYRVLCIDDNAINLKLMAQLLGLRQHIEFLSSMSPHKGIELARSTLPDLILLDINMPELDGFAVLKRLKSQPELSHIPVVAVTADALPLHVERGLDAGFSDYVTKPLNVNQFLKMIDRHLQESKGAPTAVVT